MSKPERIPGTIEHTDGEGIGIGIRAEEAEALKGLRRDLTQVMRRPPPPGPDWKWCEACEEWEGPR